MKLKRFKSQKEWKKALKEADIYVKEAEKWARGEEPVL